MLVDHRQGTREFNVSILQKLAPRQWSAVAEEVRVQGVAPLWQLDHPFTDAVPPRGAAISPHFQFKCQS